MDKLPGVYYTQKKDNTPNYRAGITIDNKHISLGSFTSDKLANQAYLDATRIYNSTYSINDCSSLSLVLPIKKVISIINLRDNGIYFKTPIYLFKKYFFYYIDAGKYLIFDVDDLFYYSTHSIMKRGGHLFVADYGMQVNVLSRYGIKEHAVCGRDYSFANDNPFDFRYGNVIIINKYHGVQQFFRNNHMEYKTKIHINGDFIVGTYNNEDEAAIAYNKAADILKRNGCKKCFPENYPESISASTYAAIYSSVKISSRIKNYSFT